MSSLKEITQDVGRDNAKRDPVAAVAKSDKGPVKLRARTNERKTVPGFCERATPGERSLKRDIGQELRQAFLEPPGPRRQ